MPRTPRRELPPEGIFHVTARGVAGMPIFTDDLDRLEFMRLLDKATSIAGWTCHAYCLLSTHYHLVLEGILARLSLAMHRLNGVYALRFNRRHDRRGHVFESRFSAWVVGDERHLSATCEYVLANPVKAGLADAVGDWPWAAAPIPGSTAPSLLPEPEVVGPTAGEAAYVSAGSRSSSRRRTSASGTSEKSS